MVWITSVAVTHDKHPTGPVDGKVMICALEKRLTIS
jgi:hypothetical protein